MFKTICSNTMESFKRKGYRTFSNGLFRGWVMYAPDEKIPSRLLEIEKEKNEQKEM